MSIPGSGLFVAVEGVDGSGKSSLAMALRDALAARGERATLTRPLVRDSDFVRELKTIYRGLGPEDQATKNEFLSAYFTNVLCVTAAAVIAPAVAQGAVVIADRYLPSHVVSQAVFGRPLTAYRTLLDRLPVPDLTILLEVPVQVAVDRVAGRYERGAGDDENFLRRAAEGLKELAQADWLRLDGQRPPGEILDDALAAVAQRRIHKSRITTAGRRP